MEHRDAPAVSDAEFEEIMGRNRTVSSSAISRAVADAAAGKTLINMCLHFTYDQE